MFPLLTLDFKIACRVFGDPVWLTGDLFGAASWDGNSGVPGGVRSLKVNKFIAWKIDVAEWSWKYQKAGNKRIKICNILVGYVKTSEAIMLYLMNLA
jgi:hypothetical protein